LSVGAYLPTVTDYILWLAARYLPTQLPARGGLIEDATTLNSLPQLLRGLADTLQDQRGLDEFKRDLRTRERLSSEFDTELFLSKTPAVFTHDTRLALTSNHAPVLQAGEMPVNGGRLKLEPLSRAIVDMLGGAGSLTFAELCLRLPQAQASVIQSALMNLASHDVLNIIHG
jgi:hypothetical protein